MRTRAAIALATTVAALAAGTGAATAAIPAVQDDYLPVSTSTDLKKRLDLVQASGAKVTRFDLFWSDVAKKRPKTAEDPADPAYNFSRADKVISGLLDRGIRPIVCVYSSPAWAAKGKKDPGRVNANAPDPVEFGKFMEAVARRYDGTFPVREDGSGAEIRHWELWNEGNLTLFLKPQFDRKGKPASPVTYAAMVKAAYPRIKRANPDAVVIAGVTGPKSKTNRTGLGTLDWMAALRASRVRFDAYSQHIYPAASPLTKDAPVPSWSSIPALLKEVDKFRRGMPMYITEAGYTTARTPFRANPGVSEATQSANLIQMFSLPAVRTPRIPVIVWFNLQDNVNWPAGLLRANGKPKPSWTAFKQVAAKPTTIPPALQP